MKLTMKPTEMLRWEKGRATPLKESVYREARLVDLIAVSGYCHHGIR